MFAQLIDGGVLLPWLLSLGVAIAITLIVESLFRSRIRGWGLETGQKIWAYIIGFAFLCSLSTAPFVTTDDWGTALFFYALPIAAALVYFAPTAVAIQRSVEEMELIFFTNLLAGWTVVGWVVTLIWSLRSAKAVEQEMVAERMAQPEPQKGPFITPDMWTRQPPRYKVGKGVVDPDHDDTEADSNDAPRVRVSEPAETPQGESIAPESGSENVPPPRKADVNR